MNCNTMDLLTRIRIAIYKLVGKKTLCESCKRLSPHKHYCLVKHVYDPKGVYSCNKFCKK